MSHRGWNPLSSLEPLVEDGYLSECLYTVKSGKEATVVCCRAGVRSDVPLVAAKVYRPREHRGFRDDAVYWEGRIAKPHRRESRAMIQRTRRGMEMLFGGWIAHEMGTLVSLHGAGLPVPKPITSSGDVVLMEFVGDEDGAAPPLVQVDLSSRAAIRLFGRLVDDIERMLRAGFVHGDLSAYNLLYWQGRIVIIDLPQAVDVWKNRNAYDLLQRDLARVYEYFAAQGVAADPERIANALWHRARRPDG